MGVTVKATKAGYSEGPRAAGDTFEMPLNKDGSEPTGSWFEKVAPKKVTPQRGSKSQASDDELA